MRTSELRAWPRRKLGDFFRLKHGYAFKGKYFSSEGKYILLTPGNFAPEGGIKLKGEKEKYYIGQFPDEFLLKSDELLVVMTDLKQDAPILGSAAFVPVDNRFLHNQRLGKVVDLRTWEIYERYLYYLFNSSGVRGQIKASATGATVRHTAPDRIYSVDVSLPGIETQRKIAFILSAYDDLIENNLRRIKILDEMAQALYREWFVKFRFPGHEKARMVDSPLGKIPEGWEVKTLCDFGEIITGKTPSKQRQEYYGDYMPFIKLPDMHGNIFCLTTQDNLSSLGTESQNSKTIPPSNLCVSCIGTAGIVTITSVASQTNQQINSIILGNVTDLEFLYFSLVDLKETIVRHGATGATMTNLSRGKFAALQVSYPKQLLVEEFHDLTTSAFQSILNLQQRNQTLRRTRDLLLPKLISSELDVSELEIETGGIVNG